MTIHPAKLLPVEKVGPKPAQFLTLDAIVVQFFQKDFMVHSVESFFEIDKNCSGVLPLVNIQIPVICAFEQTR